MVMKDHGLLPCRCIRLVSPLSSSSLALPQLAVSIAFATTRPRSWSRSRSRSTLRRAASFAGSLAHGRRAAAGQRTRVRFLRDPISMEHGALTIKFLAKSEKSIGLARDRRCNRKNKNPQLNVVIRIRKRILASL